jgi:hypothetical protein
MDIKTLSPQELEDLGKEIGRLQPGQLSTILTGIVKGQKYNFATRSLIGVTQYFEAVHRGAITDGHKQQMG